MKTNQKLLILFVIFCIFTTKTTAQTSLNASGGSAIGAGGTLTFSVGQLVYTRNADATRSVAQGVQQPFQTLIPLGVSLLNFSAKCNANGIIFNWCTISEENNAYFTLESSKDAINFTKIAKIKGNNTTNNTNCYEFTLNNTDINANNLIVTTNNPVINANNSNITANYYRLSQTDTDNTTNFFKVISKNCNATNDFAFNIFPNPNNGIFTIVANADMTYKITNSLGQSLQEGQISTKQINLSHLSKGIYYVIGQNNNKIITKKIVIE